MNDQDIKKAITERLHEIADEADWQHLTITQKSEYYTAWTNDPEIGGKLSQVIDEGSVRVYLKDTIIRSYSRSQRLSIKKLVSSLPSVACDEVTKEFIKPQAVLCDDKNLYTIAAARDWKTALLSAFERGCEEGNLQRNIVFFTKHTRGRFVDESYRDLISAAAKRLDIEVFWVT